jgi:hypothetical protein
LDRIEDARKKVDKMVQRPDEIVAERIVGEFLKNGLIEETENLACKLSNGQISSEDWKLIAKLSIEKAGGTENAQTT